MRHILTEISTKFKLRIKYVLKRFVKRAPGVYIGALNLIAPIPGCSNFTFFIFVEPRNRPLTFAKHFICLQHIT